VAHACNPNYSGVRSQEDCSSKQAQVTSSQNPILKKHITPKKRAGRVAQGVDCEFKPQSVKKILNINRNTFLTQKL
jgi:hypothetical protein